MTNTHTTPEETQRFHGERVEARQRERADTRFFQDHRVSLDEDAHEFFERIRKIEHRAAVQHTVDALFAAMLLDIVAHAAAIGDETGGEPAALANAPAPVGERFPSTADLEARFAPEAATTSQDRIDPIDEANEPPFFKFWEKLNKELRAAGKPDAFYAAAKRAFEGGDTPVGALTFVGKNWDGLRAVPSDDGGYNGEFREVSDEGTVWRVVHNGDGPREYSSAEGALYGARGAKKHAEDHHANKS